MCASGSSGLGPPLPSVRREVAQRILNITIHCKNSVLKIQENIHEDANLKFHIPGFLNFQALFPEHNHLYRAFGSKLPRIFFNSAQ
jgi:hypothetical protein